ncbi:MAG: 4Fe-4S binding protein [Thermodesulfovibrionales bacterium]|nr:4Fe-4S binding protein [Thermodesulfovibrionales bacterium]
MLKTINPALLHRLRKATQIAFMLLIFLMPVFNILRYDTAARELYIFGQVWTLGLKAGFYNDTSVLGAGHISLNFFLKAILPWVIVLSIFPVLGALMGRFFCGWLCPEGALFELADFLSLKLTGRRSIYRKLPNDPEVRKGNKFLYGLLTILFLLVLPPFAGIALTGYFISPKTIWQQVITWDFSFGVKAGIIGVSIYIFITSIFVKHTFCKYVCAPGLMQMFFGLVSPKSLRIVFDRKNIAKCTDCKGCEKVCFMGVKPRQARKDVISCVNCGECITACERELGKGNTLFSFNHGEINVDEKISAKENSFVYNSVNAKNV